MTTQNNMVRVQAHSCELRWQSLEFVSEMRILTEMKIENRGTKYFPLGNNRQAYFFAMKIKMMVL